MATPSGTWTTHLGTPETTIEGTNGGDVLGGLNKNDNLRINGLGSIDEIHLKANNGGVFDSIKTYSGDGADSITTHSTISNSLIQGGQGGDSVLIGSAISTTTVRGGSANDTLTANLGSTSSMINGNKNIDTIFVGNTHNSSSIHGGDGNDTINLVAGILNNSSISGDKGDDVITDQGQTEISFAMNGNSGIYGNDGNDEITLTSLITSAIAQGGAGNDSIYGGTVDDTLTGGADDDVIDGNAGADTIAGSAGNDTITGGAGIDEIAGGDDDDVIKYATSAALIAVTGAADAVIDSIDGGDGSDTIEVAGGSISIGAGGSDTLARITTVETLKQTAVGATTFVIDTTAEMGSIRTLDLSANTAIDTVTLTGVTADMTILTGEGADVVTGGSGDDTITATEGADVITGGLGSDRMTGGNGADDYHVSSFATGAGTVDKDTITDFTVGTPDQVGKISVGDMNTFGISLTELKVQHDVANGDAMKHHDADISADFDLDGAGANTQVLIVGEYANAGAVQTDVRDHLVSVGTAADEGILIQYDDGTDTTLAVVDFVGAVANGNKYTTATVTDLLTFAGHAASETIVDANYLAFIT